MRETNAPAGAEDQTDTNFPQFHAFLGQYLSLSLKAEKWVVGFAYLVFGLFSVYFHHDTGLCDKCDFDSLSVAMFAGRNFLLDYERER